MKTWKIGMLLLILSFGLWACDDDEKTGPDNGEGTLTKAELSVANFGYDAKTVLKNSGRLEIPVLLDKKAATAVKVTVGVKGSAAENAAREGMDFNIEEKVVNIPVGDTIGFVKVDILDNQQTDVDREFTVMITGVFGGGKANTEKQNCRISIVSNSFVEFEKPVWEMYESSASAEAKEEWQNKRLVPLVITGEISESSTVVIGVRDNTASEYIHFDLKEHEVTVKPGDTRVMVEVLPIDDEDPNDDRNFDLYIKEIKGGNLIKGKNNLTSTVTIISEEIKKTVSFESVVPVKINDDEQEIMIPVIIDKIPDSDVKVRVAASSLSTAQTDVDFIIETPEVVIDQTRRAEIKVKIIGNNEVDADRQLVLQLRSVQGTNTFLSETESTLTVDIANNDFPAFASDVIELEEDSESKVKIAIPAVNRERVMKFEAETGSSYFTISSEPIVIPAGSDNAELPVKLNYKLDFPAVSQEAVVRLTEVDGFTLVSPIEATLKMVECRYRKMLGEWTITIGYYEVGGGVKNNIQKTVVLAMGSTNEEKRTNWGKKILCDAPEFITEPNGNKWNCSWEFDWDAASGKIRFLNQKPVLKSVPFSTPADIYFDIAAGHKKEIPLIYNNDTSITWNTYVMGKGYDTTTGDNYLDIYWALFQKGITMTKN